MTYQSLKKYLINKLSELKKSDINQIKQAIFNFALKIPRYLFSLTPPVFGGIFFMFCFMVFILLRSHFDSPPHLLDSTAIVLKIEESKSTPLSLSYLLNGITKASVRTSLKSDLRGPVDKILVKPGTFVKKGDPILEISNDTLKGKLESAKAKFDQKELEFKASEQLHKKGVKTLIDMTQSKADLESARSERAQVEGLVIKAPADGYIDSIFVDEGDHVTESTELVRFLRLSPLKVISFISERSHSFLKLGQAAMIDFPILNKKAEGKVTFISKSPNLDTKTYEINIEIENTEQQILDGMSCDINIKDEAICRHKIPLSSVTLNKDGLSGIKIIDEESKVQFLPININEVQEDGFIYAVFEKENFNYIRMGANFVEDGQKVDIKTGKIQ